MVKSGIDSIPRSRKRSTCTNNDHFESVADFPGIAENIYDNQNLLAYKGSRLNYL